MTKHPAVALRAGGSANLWYGKRVKIVLSPALPNGCCDALCCKDDSRSCCGGACDNLILFFLFPGAQKMHRYLKLGLGVSTALGLARLFPI